MTAINNKYPATILCCNNNFIFLLEFLTVHILTSYNNIGSVTSGRVNTSDVGVMLAVAVTGMVTYGISA